jgi:CRISPR-associated endonuclease/helicase Cas3
VVAVVLNRVKRAREIFEILLGKGARPFADPVVDNDSNNSPQTALLIGRTRDLDRNELTDELVPRAEAGRKPATTPLIAAATQCIEAGADFDFDALISEIAPLDCLCQRFGRVNRIGRPIDAESAIIASSHQIRRSAVEDPIYGAAPRFTSNLLLEKSATQGRRKLRRNLIDFGVERYASWAPASEALKECLASRKDAPVLMPSATEFWSRTSPRPAIDPEDIALYLHGPKIGVGDIEIVWREDLNDDKIDDNPSKEERWKDRVWVCPPSSLEAISIPISEARLWLAGQSRAEIADVEAHEEDAGRRILFAESSAALRWRGKHNQETRLINAMGLRPGDVVIVPASRGGCDRWGWAPSSSKKVSDLGRTANLQQRGRDILRLSAASSELSTHDLKCVADMDDWSNEQILDQFVRYFEETGQTDFTKPLVVRAANGTPLAIERKRRQEGKAQTDSAGEAVTEDDESLRGIQKRVLLAAHSRGVQEYARGFAERAGLPSELVEDLALAGYLHDAGKAHPEFKCFLCGGDELAALAGPDLAKSARMPESTTAMKDVPATIQPPAKSASRGGVNIFC